MNVHCHLETKSNSLMVYRNHELVAVASEGLDGPEVTVFGDNDSLRVLTFNDFEIIADNWNMMQELRAGERRARIVRILQEKFDKRWKT